MSIQSQWTVARQVNALERDSGCAFDILTTIRWHEHWFDGIYWGLVVDAPSRHEIDLLGRAAEFIMKGDWDGTVEGVQRELQRVASEVEHDPVAMMTGEEKGEGGGVSIGGLASCEDSRLVAFRLGRFRVCIDGKEVLAEQTYLRRELGKGNCPPGNLVPLLQAPVSRMPLSRIGTSDVVVLNGSPSVVEVLHGRIMEPGSEAPYRLRMEAKYLGVSGGV